MEPTRDKPRVTTWSVYPTSREPSLACVGVRSTLELDEDEIQPPAKVRFLGLKKVRQARNCDKPSRAASAKKMVNRGLGKGGIHAPGYQRALSCGRILPLPKRRTWGIRHRIQQFQNFSQ